MKILNLFKKKTKKTILKTYKSCKTLYMRNFYEILETEDYRWLIKDFDEDSELVLNEKDEEELKELWLNIFNEYIELKNDQNIINNLRKKGLIAKLENRLFWGVTLLKLISKHPTEELIDALAEWNFRIDKLKPIDKEVIRITSQLKALRTKINIEISSYEKSIEKSKKSEKVNIDEQTINISKILELKYPILTRETTVSQWVSYINNAQKVIKSQNGKRENRHS